MTSTRAGPAASRKPAQPDRYRRAGECVVRRRRGGRRRAGAVSPLRPARGRRGDDLPAGERDILRGPLVAASSVVDRVDAREQALPRRDQRGRRQARLTAAYLREAGRFAVISSSPLRRAHHTAEVLGQNLALPVRLDPRLRERMNWGERAPEAAGSPPQPLEEFLREWERATRCRDYVPTSGDSSRAAGERFRLLLKELAAVAAAPGARGHPGLRRALLVSHGGVTVDLLRTLFGDDAVRAAAAAIDRGIPGCGITRLRRRGDAWEVAGVGDVAHLAGDGSEWPAS